MMQVEAVVKMLQPGFNVASIAAKRRNKSNPWFKRGTLFRSAAGADPYDGAPDRGRADSRKDASGHAQAGYRLAGGDSGGASEPERRKRDWRGRASAVDSERILKG